MLLSEHALRWTHHGVLLPPIFAPTALEAGLESGGPTNVCNYRENAPGRFPWQFDCVKLHAARRMRIGLQPLYSGVPCGAAMTTTLPVLNYRPDRQRLRPGGHEILLPWRQKGCHGPRRRGKMARRRPPWHNQPGAEREPHSAPRGAALLVW